MAAFVITNAYVMINSVNLSDHVRSVTIDYSAETPETTAMGSTTKTRLGGLLDWKLDVEFNQDYAAASVHITLFTLVGVPTAIIVQGVSGTEGVTNPKFTGTAILSKYVPVGGKVGDVAVSKAEFVGSGILALDVTP